VSQALRAYLAATRHPWACVLFVVPLLAAYELGVHLLAPGQPEILRNGADIWLRWGLAHFGLRQQFWPPALLGTALLGWAVVRRHNRPPELVGTWTGMVVESSVFALALWGISRGLRPLLDGLGLPLNVAAEAEPATAQTVCFLGAGVYEETLFRLLLFPALGWIFLQGDVGARGARTLAAVTSALVFAAAHNVGPHGEQFEGMVFLFRTLAGLYFVALYQLRGFGVAVGAHAGYDVLVGVIVPCA
jgi:membrane protease YdiL (CAAX protease family)